MTAPTEAVEESFDRARAQPGVFWEVSQRADGDDAAARRSGALQDMAVAVKDSFAVQGLGRRLGLTHRQVAARDAAAVSRLRGLGAVIVGKTAMDQLAWTMTGQAPGMPAYESPAVPGHLPGGSSGGAAAAVGLGIVPLALGSDSAGSIRLPAAWCGVTGFKPTHGALPSRGCAPLAPEFDTVGLIGADVGCVVTAFAAMVGTAEESAPAGARIGIPLELLDRASLDLAVARSWQFAEDRLKRVAKAVVRVDGRFRAPGLGAVFAAALAARWSKAVERQPRELVEPSVREGLARGREVSSEELIRAQIALADERPLAGSVFDRVDLLALPTTPVGPPPTGSSAPVATVSAFTRPWSAYGWPAIAIPIPGHPGMSLQIVGPAGQDMRVLAQAKRIEAALRD